MKIKIKALSELNSTEGAEILSGDSIRVGRTIFNTFKMLKYCGKEIEVELVERASSLSKGYLYTNNGRYYFAEWMYEPVMNRNGANS